MNFKSLKPGDTVFVVPQQRRYGKPADPYETTVSKLGKKYGYIKPYTQDLPFCLETGRSHHQDSNARVNNFGFDVYITEADYRSKLHHKREQERLSARLISYPGKLAQLSPDCVQKIHQILDEHKEGNKA